MLRRAPRRLVRAELHSGDAIRSSPVEQTYDKRDDVERCLERCIDVVAGEQDDERQVLGRRDEHCTRVEPSEAIEPSLQPYSPTTLNVKSPTASDALTSTGMLLPLSISSVNRGYSP